MTSRPKAVRAVITVRQQVMKHVTVDEVDQRAGQLLHVTSWNYFIYLKISSNKLSP